MPAVADNATTLATDNDDATPLLSTSSSSPRGVIKRAGCGNAGLKESAFALWTRLHAEAAAKTAKLAGRNDDDDVDCHDAEADRLPPPKQSLTLQFDSVHFSVDDVRDTPNDNGGVDNTKESPSSNSRKTILDNVSGAIVPKQLIALLGPSGSGKTSLLNILGGRVPITGSSCHINSGADAHVVDVGSGNGTSGGHDADVKGDVVRGSVTINGQRMHKRFKRHIAYVLQDDLLLPFLTVRETLMFTARLRMPGDATVEQHTARVDAIIATLKLSKCVNVIVGSAMMGVKGISGGEKKRLNIANEILSNPAMILCDEPTSGLDSSTACDIVFALKRLAESGRAVLCSIHQPSSQIFACFDRIVLLGNGRVVFHGDAAVAMQWFSAIGYQCVPFWNPADFFLDLLTDETTVSATTTTTVTVADCDAAADGDDSCDAVTVVAHLASIFAPVMEAQRLERAAAVVSAAAAHDDPVDSGDDHYQRWPTSFWQQFIILSQRAWKNGRGARFTNVALTQSILMGLIIGVIYWQLPHTVDTVQSRLGACFFSPTFWSFNSMFNAISAFPFERSIIIKERRAGTYRVSSYYFAKTLTDMLLEMAFPLVCFVLTYWMIGLRAESFPVFIVAMELVIVMTYGFGLLLSASILNMANALVALTTIGIGAMMVSGYFVDPDVIPHWLSWVQFVSFSTYSFRAIVVTEFQSDQTYACPPPTEQSYHLFAECRTQTHVRGDQVLAAYDFDILTVGEALTAIVGYAILFRIVAYFFLRKNTV